jgi:hypothetical protein
MISENDRIKPGILKLQSFSRPPLIAGDYTVKANITLKKVLDGTADKSYPNNALKFVVSAPRLSLDLSLIYGVYPLAGSTGAYHTSLPHIVLTRKTLPWERSIDTETNTNPWMCLLLLSNDEIIANNVSVSDIPANTLTNNGGNGNLIVPELTLETWENTTGKVKVMELPLNLYNNISPKDTELPYLAHTRQVDTSTKEDTAANPKGWYSVIVGNRLPRPAQDNSVFLVSLEGHPDAQKKLPDAASKRIRFVVLNQWSFQESGATFDELADNLLKKVGPLRIEPASGSTLNQTVQKALSYGYMPIAHGLRNGQNTTSWYRGPLVPVDVAYPNLYQYQSADQSLRFDPNTGLFDISYSAAWQLGRLLALKDPAFFKSLNNWKSSFEKTKVLNAAAAILNDPSNGINISPDEITEMAHNAVSDEVITDFLIELWNKP